MKLATVLSFVLMLTWLVISPHMTPLDGNFSNASGDHHEYIAMAAGNAANAPFAYRVLTPLLARLLPFGLPANFMLITALATWATGVAVYALARAFGFTPAMALIGCALFYTLYWATGWLMYDFWLTDPVTILLIVLAICAARMQRAAEFAVLLTIGVLNKEVVLCVVPLWYSLRE